MISGFAPRPQQPRNHQRPEPRPVLQRLDGDPGIIGERGREERRQRAGVLGHAKPLLKAGALVPVQIVDERERVLRAGRHGAGERAAGALQHGIDGGELGREGVIVAGALPGLFLGRLVNHGDSSARSAASPLRPALAQGGEAGRARRPAGLSRGDPAPRPQHGVRAREVVGGRAQVHGGVVPDKVFEVHQRALEPQAGAGVHDVRAADPPLPDRACAEALVAARHGILGGRERARERRPGQRIGDHISHWEPQGRSA